MLLICNGASSSKRIKLRVITSSTEVQCNPRFLPIFFPLGNLIFGLINSRLRFFSTKTGFVIQVKLLMKDLVSNFTSDRKQCLLNLAFIGVVWLPKNMKSAGTSFTIHTNNYALDVAPRILGLTSDVKNQLGDGKILFCFTSGFISLCLPKTFKVMKRYVSVVQSETNHSNELTFHTQQGALLFDGQFCLTSDLHELQTSHFVTNYQGLPINGIVESDGAKLMMKRNFDSCLYIDQAIFLGFSHNANNYYHFLIEIFPRLLQWKKKATSSAVPVICDKEIPWQLLELIELVSGQRAILISRDQIYKFKKLTYCKDFRHQAPADISAVGVDNIFEEFREEIYETQENLRRMSNKVFNISGRENIFIGRSGHQTRVPTNQDIVESALRNDYNFTSIDLTKKSIFEQIEIFSKAKIVVAVAGAALSNIMFCKPHTKVIVQIDRLDSSSRFWLDYAKLFDLDFHSLSSHYSADVDSPYKISDKELFALLDEFLSESHFINEV